jgi:outer membrane protein assembly factor BamB
MEMHSYFRDSVPREWTLLTEGIAAAGWRDLFRVSPVIGGMYTRLVQLFNTASTAATGGNVTDICTDGEQIYYVSGAASQSLIAASPINGAEIWEASPMSGANGLCTDGAYVYVTSTFSPAEIGLIKADRTTGALVSRGGTEYSCDALRTNGVYAIGISPASSTSKLVFWTVGVGAAAPTETGTVSPTVLNGLAIDADQCYVGGTRSTQDVWCYNLATRAEAWKITLPTSSAPTVAAIAADGDVVYVATDSVALTAGGNASLYCLGRFDGQLLWTMDLNDLSQVAVDDRYLFVIDSNDDLIQIKLGVSVPTVVATSADWSDVVCDCVSVVGIDKTTPTDFMRHMLGGATKTFMKTLGTDPTRRPVFTLAAPVDCKI